MIENEVIDSIDYQQETVIERDNSLKEPLTKRLVKEYQKRLRMMRACERGTDENRLALYTEFAERCNIKIVEAMQLANNINVDEIIEKYQEFQDTVEKRDVRSTEEVF